MVVEELLEFFVTKVDAQLLETVELKFVIELLMFEAVPNRDNFFNFA